MIITQDFRDGGEVEHGSGCLADVAGAESKKQQVVDELLVLGHVQFLRREPGFHVKVPNPQGFVSDVFRHELNKKWWLSNKIAWKTFGATFLENYYIKLSAEAVEHTYQSAGYPTVQESREKISYFLT